MKIPENRATKLNVKGVGLFYLVLHDILLKRSIGVQLVVGTDNWQKLPSLQKKNKVHSSKRDSKKSELIVLKENEQSESVGSKFS